MADELDAMLQEQGTASGSQPGMTDQGTDSTQSQTVEQQSPEEVEFNRLPGSARERWQSLTNKLKEKDAELERLRGVNQSYVPPAPGTMSPQDKIALQTLANAGVATDEKVDQKINDLQTRIRYENELGRLNSRYSGQNGEPQFVREEYESYVKDHPQYQGYFPEDVFKDHMFRNEFLNLDRQSGQAATGRSQTLRPSGTSRTSNAPLTPESIEETLNALPSREAQFQWMDTHREEIDKALGQMEA